MPDINEIIRREYDVDFKIHHDTALETLGGSTGRTLLCMALEHEFMIEISDEEMRAVQTVDAVHTMVELKLAEKRRFTPTSRSTSFGHLPPITMGYPSW